MKHTPTPAQPSLINALRWAQEHHIAIILLPRRSVKLWAPGVPVPAWVVNELRSNRKAIQQLRAQANVLTCTATYFHRPYWRYAGQGVYVCDACEKLHTWIDGDTKHKNQVA